MPRFHKSAPTKSFTDTTQADVATRVGAIISDIRSNGDDAVRRYAEEFDRWTEPFRLDDARVAEIIATLDQQVIDDIVFVQEQVGKLAETAIEFPPMQKGASFNLDAVKAKIEAARNSIAK